MHIILKDGMPELVDAPARATLLTCRIEFPMHPVRNQIMAPGEAVISFSISQGPTQHATVPFKAKP